MKTGDIVYQIGKLEISKSCLSVSIFKRIVGEKMTGKDGWWLKNERGGTVGGALETDLFISRDDALDFVKTQL